MKEVEKLELPHPARELLKRAGEILDRHVTPQTPEQAGWTIGGGTILAARWQHRESEDMDLLVPPDTRTLALAMENNPQFHRELRRAGAREIEIGGFSTITFRRGRIEMLAAEPEPRAGASKAIVNGKKINVLATTQILTGKFQNRSLRPPVRDLYDLSVAAERAPKALAEAVNSLTPKAVQIRLARWKTLRAEYAADGRRNIKGAPQQYQHIRNDPAGHAAEAVSRALYTRLEVHVRDGRTQIETASRSEPVQRTYEDADRLQQEMERDGFTALLERTGAGASSTAAAAQDAMRNRIDMLVLDIESDGERWKSRGVRIGDLPPGPANAPKAGDDDASSRTRSEGYER